MMMGPAPMMRMLLRSARLDIRCSTLGRFLFDGIAAARVELHALDHQVHEMLEHCCRSCGPGLASGCPWKLNAGRSVRATPCSEPSNSERCVGPQRLGPGSTRPRRNHDSGSRSAPCPNRSPPPGGWRHGVRISSSPSWRRSPVPTADGLGRCRRWVCRFQETARSQRWRSRKVPDHRVRYLRKYHQDSCKHLICKGLCGDNCHAATVLGEDAQNVPLHAEIVGNHVQPALRAAAACCWPSK